MSDELPAALGHLRQAAHRLLGEPDPTGRALSLAVQILDIEDLLGELGVESLLVPASNSARASLAAASRLLSQPPDEIPAEMWAALHTVLAEVDDHGHH